jgi:RimJ/RimL family protein N-acetyltransferase
VSEFSLSTDRLLLREWRDEDRELFATMNADPVVMEYFVSPLSRLQSDSLVDVFRDEFADKGFCPWAVELRDTDTFIGFVGLHTVSDKMTFAPAVEVGWRLAKAYWGLGYASEAGAASLHFAFQTLQLDEVVSFTSVINIRSQRVMTRIGMKRDETSNFEHPSVPVGNPLRSHVLYRTRSVAGAA